MRCTPPAVTVRFATNNSTVARAGYVDRLGAMGIRASADEIVTSTSATIEHLRRHAPGVASGPCRRRRRDADRAVAGRVRRAPWPATSHRPIGVGAPLGGYDAVIVGLDPHVDYARLAVAMAAVAGGARLIATNADARYPTPGRLRCPGPARSSARSRRPPA